MRHMVRKGFSKDRAKDPNRGKACTMMFRNQKVKEDVVGRLGTALLPASLRKDQHLLNPAMHLLMRRLDRRTLATSLEEVSVEDVVMVGIILTEDEFPTRFVVL